MKPQSMTQKEWLIKKMSIILLTPEKVINEVITHQFESATDALNTTKSVEISGFGKFLFNEKKAVLQYEKLLKIKIAYENMLLKEDLTTDKRIYVEVKLKAVTNSIRTLKPRIDEIK